MNFNSIRFASAALISALVPTLASAHGPQVPVTFDSATNKVVTHSFDLDGDDANGYTPGASTRTFPVIPMTRYDATTTTTDQNGSPTSPSTFTGDFGWYGQLEVKQPSTSADTRWLGPGLAYGQGGFASSDYLRVKFTDIAKVWTPNGSSAGGSFQPTGGELIQAARGNPGSFANTLSSDGTQGGTGVLIGPVGTSTGVHSGIRWRLLGPGAGGASVPTSSQIDDGLYLASLQVSAYTSNFPTTPTVVSSTPYATSTPYYFLFEKNAGGTITQNDINNAQAYISTNLVPEPASALTLVGGYAALALGRRRRAM